MLKESPKVAPFLRRIIDLDEELSKIVIRKDGGQYAYGEVVYFMMENKYSGVEGILKGNVMTANSKV